MTKKNLFAVALLSLALAAGCAKGGSGIIQPPPSIDVEITTPSSGVSPSAIYPTQSLTLTAKVSNSTTTAVTWSLSGVGTLTPVSPAPTPATATYVAPATPGSATVTATLVSDTSITGPLPITVVDITTEVAPATLSVGSGLTQQFTAIAVPDDAPQTFTWTCTANGVPCVNFTQDPSVSGLAYYTYTAPDKCSGNCIQISALSPLDTNGCTPNPKYCIIAKASLVASRVNGTYAFRFSGYDSGNNATAVVGTFTASNGTITSGVEEELTSSGWAKQSITGGSYTPTSADPNNSNNAGTLTLTLPMGVYPNQYQVVFDGAGDLEMIESDTHGTGSGIAQKSSNPNLFTGDQTYAFGFTGVDSGGNRVGFVGVLPMNGNGTIVSGQMDANANGSSTFTCGAGPCSAVGTYSADPSIAGLWHMVVTTGSLDMNYDFFISSGAAGKTNPLTFYVISTGPIDNTHPAVSGTMVLQDSTQTYNNAAFNGTSVSALTGAGTTANGTVVPATANVSLTLGTTDGNGNFKGQFDQNNDGVILSVPTSLGSPSFAYTYTSAGTPSNNGRYTLNMLGNPDASPVVPALPFVLYASGQNRGFLLDQSSSSVMTGTMNPQGNGGGAFDGSELPGTYAAATTSSGSSAVSPIAANLLLTSPGGGAFNVSGTQYQYPGPGPQTVTGTYDGLNGSYGELGVGAIALTAPSAQKYVIYALGTLDCTANLLPACEIESFLAVDEDTTNTNPSIIFAQQ
jgi:hypothetical protein